MSQVEVFTALHAYSIFNAIFVLDTAVIVKAAMLSDQIFISINLKNTFKQEVPNLFFLIIATL